LASIHELYVRRPYLTRSCKEGAYFIPYIFHVWTSPCLPALLCRSGYAKAQQAGIPWQPGKLTALVMFLTGLFRNAHKCSVNGSFFSGRFLPKKGIIIYRFEIRYKKPGAKSVINLTLFYRYSE